MGCVVVALVACNPQTPTRSTQGPIHTLSAAECLKAGGEMQTVGRLQSTQCVVTYADAGKRCTDGDECQGNCRIEDVSRPSEGRLHTARCQATSAPFGCYTLVEDGKASATLCVD